MHRNNKFVHSEIKPKPVLSPACIEYQHALVSSEKICFKYDPKSGKYLPLLQNESFHPKKYKNLRNDRRYHADRKFYTGKLARSGKSIPFCLDFQYRRCTAAFLVCYTKKRQGLYRIEYILDNGRNCRNNKVLEMIIFKPEGDRRCSVDLSGL